MAIIILLDILVLSVGKTIAILFRASLVWAQDNRGLIKYQKVSVSHRQTNIHEGERHNPRFARTTIFSAHGWPLKRIGASSSPGCSVIESEDARFNTVQQMQALC